MIERIQAYGEQAEVRWLLNSYGREPVKTWVYAHGVYRLPFRRYNLLCLAWKRKLDNAAHATLIEPHWETITPLRKLES